MNRVFRRILPWASLGLALLVSGCAGPRPGTRPAIYPEDPDPAVAVDAACRRAASSGRRVLLNFGANWCGDSRSLHHRLTTDPRIAPLVRERYELVMIDVGRRDGPRWDADVVRRYGRPFEGRGIPALVVLDAEGRQLTTRENNPLTDRAHRQPRRLVRFLETWAPP